MQARAREVLLMHIFPKSPSNDCNMSTQHIATYMLRAFDRPGAPCCEMLGVRFKFDHLQTWANNTQHVATRWPNARNNQGKQKINIEDCKNIAKKFTSVSLACISRNMLVKAIYLGSWDCQTAKPPVKSSLVVNRLQFSIHAKPSLWAPWEHWKRKEANWKSVSLAPERLAKQWYSDSLFHAWFDKKIQNGNKTRYVAESYK